MVIAGATRNRIRLTGHPRRLAPDLEYRFRNKDLLTRACKVGCERAGRCRAARGMTGKVTAKPAEAGADAERVAEPDAHRGEGVPTAGPDSSAAARDGPGAVLKRKLARRVAEKPADVPNPGGLLRIALGRAARATGGLPMACDTVCHATVSLTEVLERADPGMLLAVIENPDGAPGVVMLDPAPALGVIDFQLLGTVSGAAAPRRLTRTDVALVAPLLDATLGEWDALVTPDRAWAALAGFRVASFLDDPRPLALILGEGEYAMLEAPLSLSEGASTGRWMMAMPLPAAPAVGAGKSNDPVGRPLGVQTDAGPDWGARLRGTVSGCPVTLDAVLSRVRMPLCVALDLKPGMVLELPLSVLEAVQVEAVRSETVRSEAGQSAAGQSQAGQGAQVATARLGQTGGMRALRLTMDPRDGTDPAPARAAQVSDGAAIRSREGGPEDRPEDRPELGPEPRPDERPDERPVAMNR